MTDFEFVPNHTVNYFMSGPAAAGSSFTVSWASSVVDAPCGAYGYAVDMGTDVETFTEARFAADGLGGSYTVTLSADAAFVRWSCFTDSFCSTGRLHGVLANSAAIQPCGYGTQLQSPAQFLYYLTPGLIDLILTATGELWAVPFLTALWFTTINAQTLCGTGPPTAPVLTIEDFVGKSPLSSFPDFLGKLEAWFYARAWSYFCTCTPAPPGGAPPLPYPTPGQTAPTGIAPLTMFTCDGADVCTILNQLGQSIAGIQQNLASIRGQVDLVQRQKVPFAYVPGQLHSGLSGNGTLAVQGILGLSVSFSTVPGYLGLEAVSPPAHLFLGELALGTSDGAGERHRLTHNPQLLLPIEGSVTVVYYSLSAGAVADILELKREP